MSWVSLCFDAVGLASRMADYL